MSESILLGAGYLAGIFIGSFLALLGFALVYIVLSLLRMVYAELLCVLKIAPHVAWLFLVVAGFLYFRSLDMAVENLFWVVVGVVAVLGFLFIFFTCTYSWAGKVWYRGKPLKAKKRKKWVRS